MQFLKASTDQAARLMSGNYNAATTQRHHINDVRFSFYNHAPLLEALGYIWDDKAGFIRDPKNPNPRAVDLSALPKRPDKSALIIASGPTLDEALPYVKDWKGEIICCTSHAPTLVYHGHPPEHIMAFDCDCNPGELQIPGSWADHNTYLHIHPGVNPELVRWWPGKISLFRKLQPQTPFYAQEQAMGYSTLGTKEGHRFKGGISGEDDGTLLIKAQIPSLACATPAQMAVCKHLQYGQQVLVGADFSFPFDRPRFCSWIWNGKAWKENPAAPLDEYATASMNSGDPMIETQYGGLKTTQMLVFYSHQVVVGWRLFELDVVNSSHVGLLRMFPHVPFQEVLRRQNKGVKGFNLKKIRTVSEEHLARQNIYIINVGKGIIPHEYQDPLFEIPKALRNIKQQLEQAGKGDELDVDANMRRIRRLFKKVSHAS